jgi:CRISPR-associated protein Cas1
MPMKVAYVSTQGSMIRRKGDRLQVWKGDERLEEIRLFELNRLIVYGHIQIAAEALDLILDNGTDVVFMSSRGRFKGGFASVRSSNVYLRLAQYERWKDDDYRLRFSRAVVAAKIRSQLQVVKRFARHHPEKIVERLPQHLRDLDKKVGAAETVDEVRAVEGNAAAAYFKQVPGMLISLGFPGRKKHPATDPVNALMSLGYVMLTNELGALLEAHGFDPFVGYLHGLRYGRKSLALDVVEPFRSPVIDRLTIRLLNRGQILPEEFEPGEKGMRLVPEAFKRYLELYDKQLHSPSEGKGSPTWRAVIRRELSRLNGMILSGTVEPLYHWQG